MLSGALIDMLEPPGTIKRILVIQRNNIGDMVLTAPLLHGLRQAFPTAHIAVLANSYNAAVLDACSAVDQVHVYTKLKHRASGESWLGNVFARIGLRRRLRALNFDAILLNSGPADQNAIAFARAIASAATRVIRFVDPATAAKPHGAEILLPYPADDGSHQVQKSALLGMALGLAREAVTGPCKVTADLAALASIRAALAQSASTAPVLGIHLSARRPDQRWPAAQIIAFARSAHTQLGCRILLLWSPGSANDRLHPGDDEKALEISQALAAAQLPVLAWPTASLPPLIAALAACDVVVAPDGGAMHLAAGVGTPVVALFGSAEPKHWHPWGVAHRVLRPSSRTVADLDPATVLEATLALLNHPHPHDSPR